MVLANPIYITYCLYYVYAYVYVCVCVPVCVLHAVVGTDYFKC